MPDDFTHQRRDRLGLKGLNETKENVVLELAMVKNTLFLYVHFGLDWFPVMLLS